MRPSCVICTSAEHVELRFGTAGLVRMLCDTCAPHVFAQGTLTGKPRLPDLGQLKTLQARVGELEGQLQTAYVQLGLVIGILRRIGGYLTPEDQHVLRAARVVVDG